MSATIRTIFSVLLLLASGGAAFGETKIIIAHRGASGYLPEHTLEAYTLAHAQGAHYIEPDLVRTKDGAFIALHDIHLESTTDVEERFPDRKREDDRWYAADFTLEEIRSLAVHERLPGRFPKNTSSFRVPTLEEVIELVQGLNKTTGREAGIYPELKDPSFHAEAGLPMEADFLAILKKYGYEGPDAKCFVQCFERAPLEKMRNELGSTLPQVYLIGSSKDAATQLNDENLKAAAAFANGIGPDKGLLERDPTIVERAHKAGLLVHPYTIRRDQKPSRYATTADEFKQVLYKLGADGVFADFPDDGIRALAP